MKRNEYQLLWVSAILAMTTITLTYIVINNDLANLDGAIASWFATWWIDGLTPIVRAFTFLADNKVSFVLINSTLAYLLYKKLYPYAFLLVTSAGGGVAITYAMKLTIARDRPGEVLYMFIWGLFTDVVSYSFPSGHALKGTILFGVIIYVLYHEMKNKNLKKPLIAFLTATILIIGVGQVIRDRHFASDILGGYLVALTWLSFCIAINRPLFTFILNRLPGKVREKIQPAV